MTKHPRYMMFGKGTYMQAIVHRMNLARNVFPVVG